MSDREKKIAEIREGLEKATQGPWKIADTTDGYVLLDADDRELAFCDSIGRVDDVRFIANVPEWLRFLLDELERMQNELEYQVKRNDEHREVNQKLQEERDKLIEALRWYADEKNHKLDESTRQWETIYSPYEMDGGQRARSILKEIGVTVE